MTSTLPSTSDPKRSSLASRLLLPLLLVVALVMAAFTGLALVIRERTLVAEARRETQAYAVALGLALDAAFRDPERREVPEIVARISREPSIYGVVVYDLAGRLLVGPGAPPSPGLGAPSASEPPPEVAQVLASGSPTQFERAQDDVPVYSVVRPVLSDGGQTIGAFEVLQPLSFVDEEKARTRIRYLVNTVVLFITIAAVLLWLVRRLVSEPLQRFSQGVRAWGRGRLDHRMDLGSTVGELASAAEELNRMAEGLERARADLVRGAEERLSLERRIRQSEKMAMIGQLAASLAHEIGAPLHVIRGRADLLTRRVPQTEGREGPEGRNLRIIVEQIDRITRIVRTLLDFASHREPRLAPIDVVGVLDAVLELVSIELSNAGIEATRTGLSSAVVLGDRDQLQQVFLNLVLNSLQALGGTSAGERAISMHVRRTEGEDARSWIEVEVLDSGPGIPSEHRAKIFEPFFTTKSERSGSGLGLAVASWIVEDHGGSMAVGDHHSGGAVFTVRLPLLPEVSAVA